MDWVSIIAELRNVGLSQTEIARRMNASRPYVSLIASGARRRLSYEHGTALMQLYTERIAGQEPAGA
jgi:transcriptional regulator with XRE-family HTH domain